jgi:hypothetical protein
LSTSFTSSQEAEQDWNNGKTQRNVGIGVTVGGAVVAGVGVGLIVAASTNACPDTGNDCHYALAGMGGVFAIASVPVLIVGTSLWLHGNHEMSRAESMGFGSLGAMPYVAPLPGGGGVAGISLSRF